MSACTLPPPEKKQLLDNESSAVPTGDESSTPTPRPQPQTKSPPPEYRKSDEVAKVRNGKLIFGILEYPVKDAIGQWHVRWNTSDTDGIQFKCPLRTVEPVGGLTFTDRALYKGCKIRKANAANSVVGICRDVMLTADLRVVGTSTIIPSVNIDLFRHLKDYKQKSVVYKSGWLGVINDVQRLAKIRLNSGHDCRMALNELIVSGPLHAETPWINEEIGGMKFQASKAKWPTEEIPPEATGNSQTVFLEDLEVTSVQVLWRYQVDPVRPDTPPKEIKGARLKDLQIVMEELSSETTYQVGNLGRFTIRPQTDFLSMEKYSTDFVNANMGSEELKKLNNPYVKSPSAYDNDPESRLTPDRSTVVEIVHTVSVGDIMWQDGRMEWVSGKELIVQDESLLDNVITPGDFLYSKEFEVYGSPEKIYSVVTKYDLKAKQITLKVLTCENPPKFITNKCLPESDVVQHPRYKYFNQVSTVVVSGRDESIWVGHVRRTNPEGKVQVLWYRNGKEEWLWPAECSVYSVKGHDLECIISLINDEDEVKEVDLNTKFLRLVQKIRNINEIWNEVAEDISTDPSKCSLITLRQQSLKDLRTILLNCSQIEDEVSKGENKKLFFDASFSLLSNKIGELTQENQGDVQLAVIYTKPELVSTMVSLCSQLLEKSDQLLSKYFETQAEVRTLLASTAMMDSKPIPTTSSSNSSNQSPTSPTTTNSNNDGNGVETSFGTNNLPLSPIAAKKKSIESIFSPNVVVEDSHPVNHHYGKNTEFQPKQMQYFAKIVRNELNNLRDQCPPEIKIKAFGDRFDLFSILIGGPISTPYENSLYLFEAMLPSDYPNVPPKFHFHSYAAGRLNPNLYEQGKVCVSLLGTWSSPNHQEKWTKESNLVQILLSIQALILVKEPYHNEPGLEADKYTPDTAKSHCHTYNNILIPKVMTMMINQIDLPMEPWKDEIHHYYKLNLPLFIARWERWLEVASRVGSLNEFNTELGETAPEFAIYPITATLKSSVQAYLPKMKKLLDKLNNGGTDTNSNPPPPSSTSSSSSPEIENMYVDDENTVSGSDDHHNDDNNESITDDMEVD